MSSRQERRKAERDAAKRAPAQAGAAGAGGAAAARANPHPHVATMNPRGDSTTQAGDPNDLFQSTGPEILKTRADRGDREAQYTLGYWLVSEAEGPAATRLGTAGRSPKADVGLALYTYS